MLTRMEVRSDVQQMRQEVELIDTAYALPNDEVCLFPLYIVISTDLV